MLLTAFFLLASFGWFTEPVAPMLSAAELDRYAGRFQDKFEPDMTISVYRDGDHLMAETERYPPLLLKTVTRTEFAAVGAQAHFTFAFGRESRAISLRTVSGPLTGTFNRIGEPVRHQFREYSMSETTIPMRDGVKLHAVIARPTDTNAALPILLERTPYGARMPSGAFVYVRHADLPRSGYIFVVSDIRGRFQSEGEFVMIRPLTDHTNPRNVDESTDAYDTVDWLVKNIPNHNGRVGVTGVSYNGFLAMEAGIDPHPAVKAISPQAPMVDVWLGDDCFHNGAFRQSINYSYGLRMESSKDGKDPGVKIPDDEYDFFLKARSFDAVTRQAPNPDLPTWVDMRKHPAYDEYWRTRGVQHRLSRVSVPTLTVGGYYDQEDMWGAQEGYAALEKSDAGHSNFLVLGPWSHGQWQLNARHLAKVDWEKPSTDEFRTQFEAPFFAKYLKDEAGFDLEDTASFQTGSNSWHRYSHWPPAEAKLRNLFLQATGALSDAPPATKEDGSFVSYISDPGDPVPYVVRPVKPAGGPGSHWTTWMAEDQRLVANRKDVATWQTGPLSSDVTVTGEVTGDLFAATSGSDADWVVKLIDVYPDDFGEKAMQGYRLMTNAEILRGRYRKSMSVPMPIAPDAVEEYTWSLHGVDHVFKAGHRMMVTVQSSWFPLYDRNPQKYVPNIMLARPEDFIAATQRIYTSSSYPSHLVLPVMGDAGQVRVR